MRFMTKKNGIIQVENAFKKGLFVFLLLIINGCYQKNNKKEEVVKSFLSSEMEVFYVESGDVLPTLCFAVCKKKDKAFSIFIRLFSDFFEDKAVKNQILGVKNKNEGIKYPNSNVVIMQLDECLQVIKIKYPLDSLKVIMGDTFVFADCAFIDSRKVVFTSIWERPNFDKAIDEALTSTPLFGKLNGVLNKYGLKVETLQGGMERKYMIMSGEDIMGKCNISDDVQMPDSIWIMPIEAVVVKK